MRINRSLLVFTMTLAFIDLSFAQTWKEAKGIGISSSLIKFEGGQIDRAALGNWGGITMRYGVSPYLMLDFNAGYGSFKPNVSGEKYKKDPESPYRTFLFPISLAMKATPLKETKFRPYITAGLGVLIWDLRDVSSTNITFWENKQFRWGRQVNGAIKKNFSFIQGLGLEYHFNEKFAFDLQGRFYSLLDMEYDNVGLGDYNDQIFEAKGTISYYFDYYQDTDKDGIEDKFDADPMRPEDYDGYQDKDGAPDFDNDRDRIPDLQDRCPNEAEDHDGFQDQDGCPDHDNDGDGIPDVTDNCPNEPEDFDGFQDEDGCPDYDSDGDGIPDEKDKCPTEAETVNGFEDEDGCPDTKPVPELEAPGTRFVLRGINFSTGSATLTAESLPVLNKMVTLLQEHKDVEIEVRGYTDSVGSATANQRLSERRAKTVMDYLIEAGIDASRLSVVGHGEKDPIASNRTAEGRAQNRRIEFFRIK
ncbi:OmpA family protein [candidate division KSB1 bacterium]|nr:OmpA family protein [candidate division KSB1 bacterium]